MSEKEPEAPTDEAVGAEKKPFPMKLLILSSAGALATCGAVAGAVFFLSGTVATCPADASATQTAARRPDPKNIVFVALEPLVITLGPEARSRYLKISITLETTKTHEKALNEMSPRIRDMLNAYLRSVEEDELARPASMARLRAQMLRRLKLVAPADGVVDLLITDFVLT
jgi:flagellar FliL protein